MKNTLDRGIPDPGPVGAFSFSHVMVTKSLLFVTITDRTQYISIAMGGMKKASLVTLALPKKTIRD
jgi:hypothetical protein